MQPGKIRKEGSTDDRHTEGIQDVERSQFDVNVQWYEIYI